MARLYVTAALEEFLGVGPDGQSEQTFTVPDGEIMEWIRETGNTSLVEDAWFIPDICGNPCGIWQGIGGENQAGMFAYAGYPTFDFARDHGQSVYDLPPGLVYVVFVTDNFVVAKFRAYEVDSDGSGFPVDHAIRFQRRLWPPA